MWIKSEHEYITEHVINIIKDEINKLYYKKIIVWCGMIEECISVGNLWKNHFEDYKLCIDFVILILKNIVHSKIIMIFITQIKIQFYSVL